MSALVECAIENNCNITWEGDMPLPWTATHTSISCAHWKDAWDIHQLLTSSPSTGREVSFSQFVTA